MTVNRSVNEVLCKCSRGGRGLCDGAFFPSCSDGS